MPVIDQDLEKTLLIDPNFHLKVAQVLTFDGWRKFVAGMEVQPANHRVSLNFLDPFYNEGSSVQDIMVWNVPPDWDAYPTDLGAKVILASGKSMEDFIEQFPGLFGKNDDTFKAAINGELDVDYGYEGFPGIEHYRGDALNLLESFLRNNWQTSKPDWLLISLRLGYRGEHNADDLLDFLMAEEHPEENYTKDEEKRREAFRDALESGLRDSYQMAYRDAVNASYVSAIKGHEFHNANLSFSSRSWGEWELTTTFKELVEFGIQAMSNTVKGTKRPTGDPFFYKDIDEDSFIEHFYSSDKIEVDDSNVDIGDMDTSYGYDYFNEQMREADIFPKGVLR